MPSGFEWTVPPSRQLMPGVQDYGKKVLIAVQAVGNYWGQMVQDAARQDARWEDRTGNARSGLFFAVDGLELGTIVGSVTSESKSQMKDVTIESGDKNTLIITLGHTVFYGRFLELSNGGRYAVVMSTIEKNLPALERMLKDTFA